jgi:hypothetical protein
MKDHMEEYRKLVEDALHAANRMAESWAATAGGSGEVDEVYQDLHKALH